MKIVESDRLRTLNAIRRDYFALDSRPSRSTLERWIVFGVDGLRLPALKIDGAYYVKPNEFEAFLAALAAPTVEPRRKKSAVEKRVDAAIERAKALGVKIQ